MYTPLSWKRSINKQYMYKYTIRDMSTNLHHLATLPHSLTHSLTPYLCPLIHTHNLHTHTHTYTHTHTQLTQWGYIHQGRHW